MASLGPSCWPHLRIDAFHCKEHLVSWVEDCYCFPAKHELMGAVCELYVLGNGLVVNQGCGPMDGHMMVLALVMDCRVLYLSTSLYVSLSLSLFRLSALLPSV